MKEIDCPGGVELHLAHMDANGECPWCYEVDDDFDAV